MGHSAARNLLKQFLTERNAHYERKTEIDQAIKARFEKEVAVLALDMCGFSRTSLKFGIVHFLAMIIQMESLVAPIISQHSGTLVKQEADNLFAVFPTSFQAVATAKAIFECFNEFNLTSRDSSDILGSIGIGYGSILLIDDEDLFGNEVNLAAKLGEDIAGPMEILLTSSAFEALASHDYDLQPTCYEVSGIEINCYRLA